MFTDVESFDTRKKKQQNHRNVWKFGAYIHTIFRNIELNKFKAGCENHYKLKYSVHYICIRENIRIYRKNYRKKKTIHLTFELCEC